MGWGYKSVVIPSPSQPLPDNLTLSKPSYTLRPPCQSPDKKEELSEIMDVMTAAETLRNELIAYTISERNVEMLDHEISSLGEQCLLTAMDNNQSKHLCLLLRLSVIDGVQHMYKQCTEKKWAQVQSTAQQIKASLEADDTEMMTSPVTSSQGRGSSKPDQTADQWTTVFCELSRHE